MNRSEINWRCYRSAGRFCFFFGEHRTAGPDVFSDRLLGDLSEAWRRGTIYTADKFLLAFISSLVRLTAKGRKAREEDDDIPPSNCPHFSSFNPHQIAPFRLLSIRSSASTEVKWYWHEFGKCPYIERNMPGKCNSFHCNCIPRNIYQK